MRRGRRYVDFDISIEPATDGYRARVIDSPAGEAASGFSLPFSELELENYLLKVGRPTRGTRRLESPEMEATRAFGAKLFEALFRDDLRLAFRRSLDEAEREGAGLRIRLRLGDAPELSGIPWEYLFNPAGDRFVVLSAWTPLVRYVDLPRPAEPLRVTGPLRILTLISSPRDYPTLDVEAEWGRVETSLRPIMERGAVAIDRVENATLLELQRALRRNEYHVFHYVGHGGFDAGADDGVLVLEDGNDRSRVVSGRDLGTILHDHRSLRLAVLNACEGARTSNEDPFAGTAQSLVRQGIPAVVAMQFEITDDAAIAFSQEFYSALVDGYPVDAAIGEARRAIFGLGNDIEWGTPVLYMRTPDGTLFDLPDREATPAAGEPGEAAADEEPPPAMEPAVPAQAAEATEPAPEPAVPSAQPEAESTRDAETATPPADVGTPTPEPPPPDPEPAASATEPGTTEPATLRSTAPDVPAPPAPAPTGPGGAPPWAKWAAGAVGAVVVLAGAIAAFSGGGETEDTTTTLDVTTTATATTTTIVAQPGQARAQRTETPKTIDGDAGDWTEGVVHTTEHLVFTHPRIGDGTVRRAGTDATAVVRLAWDADALYVLADVEDDIVSQPNVGNQIWHGDAIDLNVATATRASAPGPTDHQITLSPGDPAAGTDTGSVRFTGSGTSFGSDVTGIAEVAAVHRTGGYVLEARIPWDVLGVAAPSPGDRFGLLVAVFDNDGEIGEFVAGREGTLQTVIVGNTPGAAFQNPGSWGTVTLEG